MKIDRVSKALISTGIFLIFVYFLIKVALRDFIIIWIINAQIMREFVFSVSHISILGFLLTIGGLTFYFGYWAYKCWMDIIYN